MRTGRWLVVVVAVLGVAAGLVIGLLLRPAPGPERLPPAPVDATVVLSDQNGQCSISVAESTPPRKFNGNLVLWSIENRCSADATVTIDKWNPYDPMHHTNPGDNKRTVRPGRTMPLPMTIKPDAVKEPDQETTFKYSIFLEIAAPHQPSLDPELIIRR